MVVLARRYLPRFIEVANGRIETLLSHLEDAVTHQRKLLAEFHTLIGEAGLLGLEGIVMHARTGQAAARAIGSDPSAVLRCTRAIRALRKELAQLGADLAPSADSGSSSARDPVRVLIVDDSEIISEHLSDALTDAGLVTQTANAHDTAISAAREFRPRLVLVDVNIEGTDVQRLTSELRDNLCSGTRVVLLSGMDDDELSTLAKDVGANGSISKRGGLESIVADAVALANDQGEDK